MIEHDLIAAEKKNVERSYKLRGFNPELSKAMSEGVQEEVDSARGRAVEAVQDVYRVFGRPDLADRTTVSYCAMRGGLRMFEAIV